jgi:uncharacterized protein YjeT (DUF2065 family)
MKRSLLVWSLGCLLGLVGLSPAAEPVAWKAGAAAVKITPETSLRMAGYAGRKKPSEGVAQDLFAKALALEDARGSKVVIVTMDLIGMSRALRDWLEAEVGRRYGLPRAGLVMNASHTHCGPSLRAPWVPDPKQPGAGPKDPADQYMAQLQQRLVALVGDALKRLAPARLDFFRARAGFAMCRRRPTDAGFRNAPNPDGPVDHEVPVLRVTDPSGKLLAVLFGYACHNTTMGDYLFRGDYAGYAQQYFQEDHPGTVALFMEGCGADQNPYPRSKEELVRYHGRTLAVAVEAALQTVPRPVGGPLSTAFEDVTLDFTPPPSAAELEQIAAGNGPQSRTAQRFLTQIKETGKLRTSYSYPVQVLQFGRDLTLVALAGEVVVDYSLRLKRELAGPAVWVAGYSNDVPGYIPSLRVLTEGGYEAGRGIAYGTLLGGFAPSIEQRIVGKVMQLHAATEAPVEVAVAQAHAELWGNRVDRHGVILDYVGEIPTPEDCSLGRPNAIGWWSPIENGPMFTGLYLPAVCERARRSGAPADKAQARRLVQGLLKCASVSDVPGFIARGIGKDGKCHYPLGSDDQTHPWFYGLHAYATSGLASAGERKQVVDKMREVGQVLESSGWKCPCDGAFRGQSRGQFQGPLFRDAVRYLYMLRAMYDVTQDRVWLDRYRKAAAERPANSDLTRAAICAVGYPRDREAIKHIDLSQLWIYVGSQGALARLVTMESDESLRSQYRAGLAVNARNAMSSIEGYKMFDNNDAKIFGNADWRAVYSTWFPQATQTDAERLAGIADRAKRGQRKHYEARFMRNPLAAAAIVALSGDGAGRATIERAIRHYDYSKLHMSEFFLAECAYYALPVAK